MLKAKSMVVYRSDMKNRINFVTNIHNTIRIAACRRVLLVAAAYLRILQTPQDGGDGEGEIGA
jgi:protein involved in ribonucleotide reduction